MKNNVDKKLVVLGLIFFVSMFISGVYAITDEDAEGMFATGAVKINVENYCLNELNEEVAYVDGSQTVIPGKVISLIPKIYNIGAKSYIRAKIQVLSGDTDLGNAEIYSMTTGFEKHGDYYYYVPEVESGSVLDFFRQIQVPPQLTEQDLADGFQIKVTAEAVQSKNFTPDYSLDDPWHGIEVVETTAAQQSTDTDGVVSNITIKFSDSTDGDIEVGGDFLTNFSRLLPGDTLSETIKIKNSGDKENEYFISVLPENLNELEEGLLKQVTVIIKNSAGDVIYNGNMYDVKDISLGEFEVNESDTLSIELSLPGDLENKYAGLSPKFAWDFSAKYEVPKGKNPDTGDFQITWAIIIFLISAVGLVVVLCLAYKQKKEYKL